jgi:hypothetical protein
MSETVAPTARAPRGGQYLPCDPAAEGYGVAMRGVREIIGLRPVTRVPRTPPFVRGVIDRCGTATAVMDLRERSGVVRVGAAREAPCEAERVAAAARCTTGVQVDGGGRPGAAAGRGGRAASCGEAASVLAVAPLVGVPPTAADAPRTAAPPAPDPVRFRPGLMEGAGVTPRGRRVIRAGAPVAAAAGAAGETLVAFGPAGAGGTLAVGHARLTYRPTADHHLDPHAGRPVAGAPACVAGLGLTTQF